jgi:ribonuclease HI
MKGNLEVTLAEAGAMMMAIQLCKRLGYNMVLFESDAQLVVEGIKSMEINWSSRGLMLEDIKRALQDFSQWKMTFTHREGNKAAHALSKIATTAVANKLWINETPDCIHDIILMEQHALSI